MKFTYATILAALIASAVAVPVAHEHHAHHLDKRDVVTHVIHQTQYFYQKQVVYVDQNGAPFSTGWEVVSVATQQSTPTPDVAEAVPSSSAASAPESVVTSSDVVVVSLAASSSSSPSAAPVVSSSSEAPVVVSTSTPVQTPTPTPTPSSTSRYTSSTPSTSSTPTPTPTPSTSSTPTPTPTPSTSSTPTPTPSTSSTSSTSIYTPPVESTTLVVSSSSSSSSAAAAASTSASSGSGSNLAANNNGGSGSSSSGSKSGDGTYYDTGLGACGITSTDSDYIVAISHVLFDAQGVANPNNNPLCGKKINAHYGGKSVTVTVVDRCPGCEEGSLDFSPSAFNQLADFDLGRIPITWDFAS